MGKYFFFKWSTSQPLKNKEIMEFEGKWMELELWMPTVNHQTEHRPHIEGVRGRTEVAEGDFSSINVRGGLSPVEAQ